MMSSQDRVTQAKEILLDLTAYELGVLVLQLGSNEPKLQDALLDRKDRLVTEEPPNRFY